MMSDYIPRDVALNGIEIIASKMDEAGYNTMMKAKAVIEMVYPADVQPVVHGRWIETEQPMEWDNVSCATCSVCGEDFVLDEWGIDDVRREMRYCMNCGARMDLEDTDI